MIGEAEWMEEWSQLKNGGGQGVGTCFVGTDEVELFRVEENS